jgi:hypothetical protein
MAKIANLLLFYWLRHQSDYCLYKTITHFGIKRGDAGTELTFSIWRAIPVFIAHPQLNETVIARQR